MVVLEAMLALRVELEELMSEHRAAMAVLEETGLLFPMALAVAEAMRRVEVVEQVHRQPQVMAEQGVVQTPTHPLAVDQAATQAVYF
jgi:hypothetical protein